MCFWCPELKFIMYFAKELMSYLVFRGSSLVIIRHLSGTYNVPVTGIGSEETLVLNI